MMNGSTRAGSNIICRVIRVWRFPNAGIGSASCKRASTQTTSLPQSRQQRRRNSFSGRRPHSLRWPNTISMVRSRAGQYDAASAEERPQHLVALVAAEIACLEGRAVDAMRFYEQAVQSARGHGFVQNEGLAHELAARFYL